MKILDRLGPGRGKLAKLIAERASVDQAVSAAQSRLTKLQADERELLTVVNSPPGSDAMARLVAREKHATLEPQFATVAAELTRLSEHRQALDNHITPLAAAVDVYKRNLTAAISPPGWMNASASQRSRIWAESALKLTGLLDIAVPAKLPDVDADERARANLLKQLNDDLGRCLYPNRAA